MQPLVNIASSIAKPAPASCHQVLKTTYAEMPIVVLLNVNARVTYAAVDSKIDTFVLDRAPAPFDENVISPGTASVYGKLQAISIHCTDEPLESELAALVSLDDFRRAKPAARLLQHL